MQRLVLKRMYRNLTTVFRTEFVDDTSRPVSSPLLAAGQLFTLGRFCREVEYDPELYYAGEEINLSARAYTHGYDFFCPNEDLVWHLYQHSMPVHWGDHHDTQHTMAIERLQTLFMGDHRRLGKYGLGTARTLDDFERHAGLSFRGRLDRKPVKTHFRQTIDLDVAEIPVRDDYDYWIFTLRSVEEEEIFRYDIRDRGILDKSRRSIELDEHLMDEPVQYMLWPPTTSEGYLRQYHRDL